VGAEVGHLIVAASVVDARTHSEVVLGGRGSTGAVGCPRGTLPVAVVTHSKQNQVVRVLEGELVNILCTR